MLKIRKEKWAAWLLCLALTCGAMVTTTACGGEDKEIGQDDEKDKRGTEEIGSRSDRGSEGASGVGSGKDTLGNVGDDDGETSGKYGATAARLKERVTAYFEAMKAGDIETVLSMTDPESEVYEKLSGVKDNETAREFFHVLYENLKYEFPEDGDVEISVEAALEKGSDEFDLFMNVGMPSNGDFFEWFFTVPGVVFQDGTLIPDDYEVKSDEEALEMVRSVAKMLPLVYCSGIEVKLREDGDFYFKVPDLFWVKFSSDFRPGENFLPEFLTRVIGEGIIVGKNDGSFEESQEEWDQILSLLERKDFDGLLALANGDLEKYAYNGKPYQTPDDLTEAQRAFYDTYVQQIEVYVSKVTNDYTKRRSYKVFLTAPAFYWYEPVMAWYTKVGIREEYVATEFGGEQDELSDVMGTLLSPLRHGIEQAKSTISE